MFDNKTLLDDCFTGEDFIAHMKNVSFQGESGAISFNNDGDMLGTYRYVLKEETLLSYLLNALK